MERDPVPMPDWFVERMNELTAEEDPSRAEREYWLPGNPPPPTEVTDG